MYLGKGSTVNLFDPSRSQLQSAEKYFAFTLPAQVKRLNGGVTGKLHLESKSYGPCVKDSFMVVEELLETTTKARYFQETRCTHGSVKYPGFLRHPTNHQSWYLTSSTRIEY